MLAIPPPRRLAPPPTWNPGSAPVSGITLGNAISISVGKMVVFYLFCIRLVELVESGEFNWNWSSMTEDY